jgi:pimeloyl-ACP methyl ester carboxylesterase
LTGLIPIRYATAQDGLKIAFTTRGKGFPLFVVKTLGDLQREWDFPSGVPSLYRRLAEARQVVRFNFRGLGHSQPARDHFSLHTASLDILAVADRIGASQFDLVAAAADATIATYFAGAHAERVRQMVLWGPAGGGAYRHLRRMQAIASIRELDRSAWGHLYSDTLTYGRDDLRAEYRQVFPIGTNPTLAV